MTFALPKRLSCLLACLSLAATSALAAAPAANDHRTIRAMSGAVPINRLETGKTALLVIDFQQEYFTGRMPIPDGQKAIGKALELIAFADKNKIPVIQVQHIAPEGSAVFARGSEGANFHPRMQPRAGDTVLQKNTVSVFRSTELDRLLKEKGIKTVIISGLMTHACVAGAARDAVPLGFEVVVASDASATRSIIRANGSKIDETTLHRAALAEIEDTFGDVMTTAQITQLPLM